VTPLTETADVAIPGWPYTFGQLIDAQGLENLLPRSIHRPIA